MFFGIWPNKTDKSMQILIIVSCHQAYTKPIRHRFFSALQDYTILNAIYNQQRLLVFLPALLEQEQFCQAYSNQLAQYWISCGMMPWFPLLPEHHQINGLVQDCSISSALAMEILQSCTKPLKCNTDNLIKACNTMLYLDCHPIWSINAMYYQSCT